MSNSNPICGDSTIHAVDVAAYSHIEHDLRTLMLLLGGLAEGAYFLGPGLTLLGLLGRLGDGLEQLSPGLTQSDLALFGLLGIEH